MSNWIARGLRRGILTTPYPNRPETMPEQYRGRVLLAADAPAGALERAAGACLSRAIELDEGARVNVARCFQCGECARVAPEAARFTNDFELALVAGDPDDVRRRLRDRVRALGRSIMIRHVDAGSDASCDQEVQALFNPFYDVNRLGVFLTPTPRHADVLLVTGVVTRAMAEPLRATYDAMPEPRLVLAVGSAAASGSIFTGSADVVGPVDRVVPVDVIVPGAPPGPLSIIHGLWVALGRATARIGSATR